MNGQRDWNEVWKRALDGLKYEGCVDYLNELVVTLWKYKLPDDVVATMLATISSYMKFEPFPTDDKYLTEGWSLTNYIWIKISSEGIGISEGIENEKQFIWFKNYIASELPQIVFKVFKLIIPEKKQNKRWRKELSDLLFKMKLMQVEINAGITKGWLDGIYPHLIELLELHRDFTEPEPQKRIYGFKLNPEKYYGAKIENVTYTLFEGLQKAKLIASNTKYYVFRTIFNPNDPIQPVVWRGKKNQLVYFFYRLYELGILQKKGKEHIFDWEKIRRCFIKEDGKSWELRNTRTMVTEFKKGTGIAQDKKMPIDNILNKVVKI